MSKWPETTMNVLKDIHLDPKNVRLEVADAGVEADIMEDLFTNEDALSLVDGICKVGFLTHDIPIVLKRRNKYVMVEGNRRLAALKAIQNPMLVPDYQARVATLAALLPDRSTLLEIRVKIAPNQSEADQLIAAIHTGNLRRPWTPGRQAAFFQAQIDAGRTLKDLLARYPTIDVRGFVFRAHILNLFKSVEYNNPSLENFLTTKQWAKGLSTLARIYGSKEFIALTGLTMDDEGKLTKSVSDETFKGMATTIVQGMFDGNINTRSLNAITSPRYMQLMNDLRTLHAEGEESQLSPDDAKKSLPVPSSSGSDVIPSNNSNPAKSMASLLPTQTANSAVESAADPRRVLKKKQRWLDLSEIKAPSSYPEATKLLLSELSEIDVQKFPNASFLVLRAVLEKSIKSFAEAKSAEIKASGNDGKGFVQLGHTLDWLLKHVKENKTTSLIQVIEKVRTGKFNSFMGTKNALDAINHNHQLKVDPDEVIAMWGSIDPIMRYLMKP